MGLHSRPLPFSSFFGAVSKVCAGVWHMAYPGCIRIPDYRGILRSRGAPKGAVKQSLRLLCPGPDSYVVAFWVVVC